MSRGIDFADIALFDWHAAITRADSRWDYGEARFSLTRTYDSPMIYLWFAYGLPMVCHWFGNQKGNITCHMRC